MLILAAYYSLLPLPFPFPPHEVCTMKSGSNCAFDTLFTLNVPHILENIFLSLDYESLKTCLKVSSTWRKLLSTAPYQKELKKMLIEKKIIERQLHTASKEGNTEEVVRLMSSLKVDVNSMTEYHSWNQSTPLIEAADNGHNDVVELLLEAGAAVNIGDKYGITPLIWAALNGNIDMVKLLLNAGAEIDRADDKGMTPLQEAAREGLDDVVQLLIDAGADVDGADKGGFTSLHKAAMNGHREVVKVILDAGAEVDKADLGGKTPLHMASGR